MILNIIFTFLLVFLNAFFVAAEFAIVKVRSSQLELRIRSGSYLAGMAKHLVERLDAYLSATQLGITLASLGLGWIGEPVVGQIIIEIMSILSIDISSATAHSIALPVAFILITTLHIVFGELAPKSMAIQQPEKISLAVAIPLRVFYLIFRPFIWLLNTFANSIIKLIGFHPANEDEEMHSPEELRYLLEESSKSGAIGLSEHELLENVFEFSDTPIKQIMVPRGSIEGIEASLDIDEIIERFKEQGFSRMPVYEKTIDNIIGIIHAKDIIKLITSGEAMSVYEIFNPAYFVQEDEKINKLLHQFQKERIHIAIVLDEFGGTAGLVTIEDIIEEIVGEIQDEYDEETPLVEKLSETEFLIKASTPVDDANDFLPVSLPESDDYETVGGLVLSKIGRIPEHLELINLDTYICKIMKRSKRSIEQVKLILKETESGN
jgi:CBS domain containing-hemolysin-like protein